MATPMTAQPPAPQDHAPNSSIMLIVRILYKTALTVASSGQHDQISN